MKRKILVGTIVVALSLFVSMPLLPVADALAAQPSISVSGPGVAGKALKVAGVGFVPGEVVELVLDMDDVPIIVGKKGAAITAGDGGRFEAETNYPHKLVAIPGSWRLTATGDKGSEASCMVEIKQP